LKKVRPRPRHHYLVDSNYLLVLLGVLLALFVANHFGLNGLLVLSVVLVVLLTVIGVWAAAKAWREFRMLLAGNRPKRQPR